MQAACNLLISIEYFTRPPPHHRPCSDAILAEKIQLLCCRC